MLNALRAFVMLLLLVGTTRAGEGFTPPAPLQGSPHMLQEPSGGETLDAKAATFELSDSLANAALELLAILPTLL